MKVFVFPSFDYGGHEVMALRLLRSAISERFPVTCIVNVCNAKLLDELRSLGMDPILINVPDRKMDLLIGHLNPLKRRFVRSFIEHLRASDATHVIVVNGNAVANHLTTLSLAQACRAVGARCTMYIPMFHTPAELRLSALKAVFYDLASSRSLSAVSDVIVISETWKKRVQAVCDTEVHVVKNLVRRPPAEMRPAAHPALNRYCFIGRLDRSQKGLDFLFEIVAQLSKRFPIHLDIVGDGPDREFVELRAAEVAGNSASTVTLHGWMSAPLPLLRKCTALIMPSRVEGAPLVALEAASIGIPVFAFNIPGVNDVVDARFLSPAFDVIHFANNIVSLPDLVRDGERPALALDPYFDEARFRDEFLLAVGKK